MHLKPSEPVYPTFWFTHPMHFKPGVECKRQQSFHCYYSLSQAFHVPFTQVRNYLFICKQPPLTLCLQYRRLIRVCLPPPHSQSATEPQRTAGSTEQPRGGHTMGLLHPHRGCPLVTAVATAKPCLCLRSVMHRWGMGGIHKQDNPLNFLSSNYMRVTLKKKEKNPHTKIKIYFKKTSWLQMCIMRKNVEL